MFLLKLTDGKPDRGFVVFNTHEQALAALELSGKHKLLGKKTLIVPVLDSKVRLLKRNGNLASLLVVCSLHLTESIV